MDRTASGASPFVGQAEPHHRWFLLIILLFAFLLRAGGVFTLVPHPDSRLAVERGFQFLTGDFNPRWFGWPGQTIMWMLAGVYGLYYCIGRLTGSFPDWAAFTLRFQQDPQIFYSLGSLVMVGFSVANIVLVYRLGRRIAEPAIALAAALFLATSWLYSMHSQYVRPDIVSIFFLLLCVECACLIRERGCWRSYIGAGVSLGAAVATKWTMAPVLLVLVVAHFQRAFGENKTQGKWPERIPWILMGLFAASCLGWLLLDPGLVEHTIRTRLSPDGEVNPGTLELAGKLRTLAAAGAACTLVGAILCKPLPIMGKLGAFLLDRHLLGMIGFSALTFLLFAPYALLDAPTLVHDLLFEARAEQLGAESLPILWNAFWYLREPLGWGYGYALQLLAIAGVIIAIFRYNLKTNVLILLFPAMYCVIVATASLRWARWVIHLLPFLAIYSAIGLGGLVGILRNVLPNRKTVADWILPAACILLVAFPVARIYRYDQLIAQPDTRVECVHWIMNNIPKDKRIAMDALAGDLPPGRFRVYRDLAHPSLASRPLDEYVEEGWEVFVVSGAMYDRYFDEPEKYPEQVAFYEKLDRTGQLLKEFEPDPSGWPPPEERLRRYHIHTSPEIRIYRVTPTMLEFSEAPGAA